MKFERSLEETEFASVFKIITAHRSRTLMSINEEMILTYWEIGAFLSKRINAGNWSSTIVEKLASYIKRHDPSLRGYSKSNLYAMATFYEKYSNTEFHSFVKQIMLSDNKFSKLFPASGWKKLPETVENNDVKPEKAFPSILLLTTFTNLLLIANNCSNAQEMIFYIVYANRERLTKRELLTCISRNTYSSLLGGNKKNYSKKLIELYPSAPVVLKDQAFLDYLSLPKEHKEHKLRSEIVAHIKDFILEIGKDFLFVDQEYSLSVGGEDFHADLLFYHRGLRCLVAFELKTKKFHPSDIGQLEFYLEALDRDVKHENENPSIGILLCRDANQVVVEYAMSRTMSPVMIAQYKRMLIPKEVLQRTFEEYLNL
ncbi:DUF1016 family protein [bacterium]|nr:DUF1016 family protein [bacterium]